MSKLAEKDQADGGSRASQTADMAEKALAGDRAGPSAPADSPALDLSSSPPAPPPATPLFSVFSKRTKIFLVLMTAFATLFSPFSSFLYLPAITPIAESYGRSVADINLSVTLYQVMQAVAPLFLGDLSDQVGRRPVYVLVFIIYLGANIGLALQNSYAALLVLRAMQSTGSSATVAIGSAVMADIVTSAERGAYVSSVQASVMFAPALAPVIGGILTEYLGWRSNFYFLIIAAGVFLMLYVPFVPETARKIVGNGSIPPPVLNRSLYSVYRQHKLQKTGQEQRGEQGRLLPAKRRKIPVPNIAAALRIALEKDVGLVLIFVSVLVMANYSILVPVQDVIRRRYHYNDLQVGLCYIPFACGSMMSALITGRLLNWNYGRVARQIGVSPDRKRGDDLRNFPIERARLDLVWPGAALGVAMTAAWGWVVSAPGPPSLAAPLVVLFFAGAGISCPTGVLSTLLVDLYPTNAGRVSSTFNLTRAALSAIGTAVVQYMIDAWGYGFTYLFMSMLMLVSSAAIPVVRHWGPKWREERYQRFEKAKLIKEGRE